MQWYTKVCNDIQEYVMLYESMQWYTKVCNDIRKYGMIYKSMAWTPREPPTYFYKSVSVPSCE